jgi:ABC-type lipoprotein release transport system permease subunit
VQTLVFASSLRFVVIGVGFGLTAAATASRWIAAQLFGVSPIDPATYFGVTVLVVFTAAAATWWPARRASRIDPAITLRTE